MLSPLLIKKIHIPQYNFEFITKTLAGHKKYIFKAKNELSFMTLVTISMKFNTIFTSKQKLNLEYIRKKLLISLHTIRFLYEPAPLPTQ